MKLIDRLVQRGVPLASIFEEWSPGGTIEEISEEIQRIPRFLCDNVAKYYFESAKETWDILHDFPFCRPPFPKVWIEYKLPQPFLQRCCQSKLKEWECIPSERKVADKIFEEYDIQVGGIAIQKEDGWIVLFCRIFYCSREAVRLGESLTLCYRLSETGDLSELGTTKKMLQKTENELFSLLYFFHPFLLSMSFANCRNIELVEIHAPAKLQRARQRRGRHPIFSYNVINILPMGAGYQHRRKACEGDVDHRAFHIRRGNYAKYGPKFGRGLLFGRLEGMFWRPSSAIGSEGWGRAEHDYQVQTNVKK